MRATKVTTAPIDELSARLQRLDHAGGSVLEIISPRGALHCCQQRLWAVVNAWQGRAASAREGAAVAAVWRHLEDVPRTMDCLRASVLNVGASVWARLEVEYTSWPWLLLNGVVSGAGGGASQPALDIHRAFFEEDACCLDASFSLPLRRSLQRVEDLQRPEMQTLLVQLRRKVLTTNMLLEGLLAQIKASVPQTRKNGSPLAEKLSYLGLLSQVLHSHIDKGHRDPRSSKPDIQTLQTMGLLDRAGCRGQSKRPDIACRNRRRSRHVDSDGAAQPVEMRAAATVPPAGIMCEAGGAAQLAELAEWPVGSADWPVAPDCLEQFLQSEGSRHGVAGKMPGLRLASSSAVLVEDQGLISPTKKFERRFSCTQAHPGLCRSKHAAVFPEALKLARHIEHCFTATDLGHYFLFHCPVQDALGPLPLHLPSPTWPYRA